LKTLEGHKWQVTAVLFRSDGSIVSAALDGCNVPSIYASFLAFSILIWSNLQPIHVIVQSAWNYHSRQLVTVVYTF
jgi:hypothetical protein